jgi:hypothetical protein
MTTILNQTSRFLRISLARGKVLRLGPHKEGQIATPDAERESIKALVADGSLKIMTGGPLAGTAAANPALRTNVQGHLPRVNGGNRGDR